jgi:hypothetical protein
VTLARPIHRLRTLTQYLRTVGFRATLQLAGLGIRQTLALPAPRTIQVRPGRVRYPLSMRTGGSSDGAVFWEIFLMLALVGGQEGVPGALGNRRDRGLSPQPGRLSDAKARAGGVGFRFDRRNGRSRRTGPFSNSRIAIAGLGPESGRVIAFRAAPSEPWHG